MKKKLSNEKINRILEEVRATMLIEGIVPDEESEKIGREYLEGKITQETSLKKIDNLVQRYLGPSK